MNKRNLPKGEKSYIATIHFVPRDDVEEEKILEDIGDILDERGYWCFGLVALTEDVIQNTSDKINYKASYEKHRKALSRHFK